MTFHMAFTLLTFIIGARRDQSARTADWWMILLRRVYDSAATDATGAYAHARGVPGGSYVSTGDANCRVPAQIQGEGLGNTIARETTRLLLPRSMALYQAGQSVTFGRISLNREGVSNGKERLAWQQVKGMKVQAGSLFIQKEGNKWLRWNNIQASDIPNVNMLLALVDSITFATL